ncbi:MAG: hypothetical protein LUD81_08255 [Clostridiales bacterium]|nr:hypothetical protein [Clostridiales bacterium]
MKKFLKIRYLIPAAAVLFILIWLCSLARCEFLTYRHGGEFYGFDEINSAYEYKILSYNDDFARIYCVNFNRTNGTVYNYVREGGQWRFNE